MKDELIKKTEYKEEYVSIKGVLVDLGKVTHVEIIHEFIKIAKADASVVNGINKEVGINIHFIGGTNVIFCTNECEVHNLAGVDWIGVIDDELNEIKTFLSNRFKPTMRIAEENKSYSAPIVYESKTGD